MAKKKNLRSASQYDLLPFKKRRVEESFENVTKLKNKQEINEEECWWDVYTEEILPRLPAKDLQTFKCVSRNWYRIISCPYFVQLHHKIYNQSRIRVLMPHDYSMMIEYKYNINSNEETKLQIPYPLVIRDRIYQILGCCDGLLCLLLRNIIGTVAVYNPSTGKYFKAQLSPLFEKYDYSISCSWFGRHPCSGEYLLVLVIRGYGNSDHEVRLYKFCRFSSWCKYNLQLPAPVSISRREERGVFLHGAVHWSAEWTDHFYGRVICAYHLDDNKYLTIPPPVQCDFKLGVVEGCLFAIFKRANAGFEMWIMKEYGVAQSWTKYANIQGFNSYRMLSPLGFLPNGDLILDVDEFKLMKYKFNDNKHVFLMYHNSDLRCGRSEAIMCDDSLVSPTMF